MKRSIGIALCALFSIGMASAASCDPTCVTTKCYRRRSDSRHKYLQMDTIANRLAMGYGEDGEGNHGAFSITPGWRGSYKAQEIAECLFGDDLIDPCCRTSRRVIKIQGSAVERRDDKAWLADYFYLPRNYDGAISFRPEISTFFADLDLYIGMDSWMCGLYFRAYAPVVNTRWKLGLCEIPGTEGPVALDHPYGYFSPANYEGDRLVQTFRDYAKGGTPQASSNNGIWVPATATTVPAENSDITFTPLKQAKMLSCSRTETGLADLRAELGWNFWQSPCKHLGINVQFAAPTGGKKSSCFLFDAVVGNGNHWEIGGGIAGHYMFWQNSEKSREMSIHFDANITHLFATRQQRTFDLKDRPNSAYMLAAKFGANGAEQPPDDQVGADAATNGNMVNANAVATNSQFAFEYQPVANLSTVKVDVSIPVQADITFLLNYRCGSFDWEIGYNFWAYSCEKIKCPEKCDGVSICSPSQQNMWGLKGDARMFGFDPAEGAQNAALNVQRAIPLSATQSTADIHQGTNQIPPSQVVDFPRPGVPDIVNGIDINPNVDNPEFAYEMADQFPLWNRPATAAGIAISDESHIKTSAQAVLLKCSDLSFTRLRSVSHTIFLNMSYIWERECWSPYISSGKAIEFGTNDGCCDATRQKSSNSDCGPCITCSVSQWSFWIKGGVMF